MTIATDVPSPCSLDARLSSDGAVLTISIWGRLDTYTTGRLCREALEKLLQSKPTHLVIDASGIVYCDGAGIAFLLSLQQRLTSTGGDVTIRGLHEEFRRLLEVYGSVSIEPAAGRHRESFSLIERIGQATLGTWQELRMLVAFVGELAVTLLHAARHPRVIRWRDAWVTAERAGIDALPITALLGFLLGLILAFQSAIPMSRFGAEIFIANVVGVSMLREMGPLMTAIVLAGRSGSAFAAELGTMKVREEIDALTTMGLDPVRFLVLPRLLAVVTMAPFLAVFANLFGLMGGALAMRSLGFPLVTFVNQVLTAVKVGDLVGGLCKTFVYGIVVAGIGCLRGLQTGSDGSAVGQSTTSAMVSGIVLIGIVEAIFSIVFYALGL